MSREQKYTIEVVGSVLRVEVQLSEDALAMVRLYQGMGIDPIREIELIDGDCDELASNTEHALGWPNSPAQRANFFLCRALDRIFPEGFCWDSLDLNEWKGDASIWLDPELGLGSIDILQAHRLAEEGRFQEAFEFLQSNIEL